MLLLTTGDIKKKVWMKGAIVFLIVLLCVVTLFFHLRSVNNQVQDIRLVTIPSGASTAEIANLLVQEQVIRNPLLFRIITRVKLLDNKLQAGEYEFSAHMSATQVLLKIVEGQTVARSFTIPEGFTVEQIAALLAEKELADREKFLQLARNGFSSYEYIKTNHNTGYAVEGFLFPDTYSISKGMKEEEILNMMLKKFDTMLTDEMRTKAREQGLDPYQLIILASLVEREARIEAERPIIAAVFLHRLQIEMPVQSCATIQYILGTPKRELSIQDTQLESPYNTYLHAGLPPGPIANPGLASILAVLNPAQTDVLYFVAKPDGTHIFSRTYEEHLQAIDRANNVSEKQT
jgi:UPF0755 protein